MNESEGVLVKELFNACVDLPEAAQLKLITASDYSKAVKVRVLKLLSYSGDIDQVISRSVLHSVKDSLNLNEIAAGQVIEQYQLIEKIGEGGQGEVWLAARNDGEFKHHVAIKLIKLSASEKELQRFQAERELLATLQHPNIATLTGGGQINERLYMIMEWINGVPLLEYLNQNKLKLAQIMACFLQVCHAVSHAHAKGVIHRDIKPSNILVTADGVVKLLDFGIAKIVDEEITQTQNDVMMTFAYSTPEQISGEHVTTATDVYALGLLLYEMLTKQKAQHNSESPAAFVKEVTITTPLKPSEVILSQKTADISTKVLQGDLDNLVMKAIRKEPHRRYANADALINDVNNYLENKPLNASGDGRLYRLGKLVKRNPLSSGLAVAVMVFMILLPIMMYENSMRLEAERDFANEQALIANKTTDFLTTLFESVSPLGHGGQDISLGDVLAQGERQLAAGTVNQPRVEAALSGILAAIHHHLENTPKAIEYYKNAVDGYQRAGDELSLLAAQGQLALMHFRNDEVDESEVVFLKADKIAAKYPNHRQAIIHLTRKATVATERGQRKEAAELLERAYLNFSEENKKDVELMSRFYHVWGEAIKYADKEMALELAKKSRKYTENLVGKMHPFYLLRVNSQAVRLMRLDRHDEARVVLDELLSISEQLFSDSHPQHSSYLSAQGTFLHDRGYFDEAETVYTNSLNGYVEHYGAVNFETARMVNNLAYLHEDQQQYAKALPLYQQSIDLRTQLDPENTIRVATAQSNLARLLAKMNQHKTSSDLLKKVMPIYTAHDRNNLYNEITQLANTIGLGTSVESCQMGEQLLADIEPRLSLEPATGWRRLGAEVWISQLLKKCAYDDMAEQWLLAAQEKAKNIYQPDSEGQKQINQLIQSWRIKQDS